MSQQLMEGLSLPSCDEILRGVDHKTSPQRWYLNLHFLCGNTTTSMRLFVRLLVKLSGNIFRYKSSDLCITSHDNIQTYISERASFGAELDSSLLFAHTTFRLPSGEMSAG